MIRDGLPFVYARVGQSAKEAATPYVVYCVTIALASLIFVGASYYTTPVNDDLPPVDRQACRKYPDSCPCWDGRNKAFYGKGGYKSVYYNFDEGMPWIVFLTFFFSGLLFKYIERCLHLALQGNARWGVILASCLCYSSLFYAWGSLFNYINDRFRHMFMSQMFFTITEMVPCVAIAMLVDKQAQVGTYQLVASMIISVSHIFVALADQGFDHFVNSFAKTSRFHQGLQARDLLFFVCDSLEHPQHGGCRCRDVYGGDEDQPADHSCGI